MENPPHPPSPKRQGFLHWGPDKNHLPGCPFLLPEIGNSLAGKRYRGAAGTEVPAGLSPADPPDPAPPPIPAPALGEKPLPLEAWRGGYLSVIRL